MLSGLVVGLGSVCVVSVVDCVASVSGVGSVVWDWVPHAMIAIEDRASRVNATCISVSGFVLFFMCGIGISAVV